MNTDEVAVLADAILRPILGPLGLDHIEVAAGRDHDDDPALFVTAHYRKGSAVPSGEALSGALSALHEGLQTKGEARFPYLDHRFGNDDGFEDDDLQDGNGAARR
jgi:hypothetical protein